MPRRVVLIICKSPHHGLLGKLRYILIVSDREVGWVDDATWRDFRQVTRQYPWVTCEIRFGPCHECCVIDSLT